MDQDQERMKAMEKVGIPIRGQVPLSKSSSCWLHQSNHLVGGSYKAEI